MNEQSHNANGTIVYIPTEANIPITEATRFNKPLTKAPEKVE